MQQQSPNSDDVEVVETTSNNLLRRYLQLSLVVLVVGIILLNLTQSRSTAYLAQRSVIVGSSLPGSVNEHRFQFDLLGSPIIGSIVFEYCVNSPLLSVTCVPPVGLNTSSPSLVTQTGETGFAIHPNTGLSQNRIIITRSSVAASSVTSTYTFGSITNPTSSLGTNFVRIYTHTTEDGSGIFNDFGAVTFSIQPALTVSVYVPPFIILCSGVVVGVNCQSSSGVLVDLGELSSVTANGATTQFAVATNSVNGYIASVQGNTMTAGNQIIAPLTSPSVSQPGQAQFGINLRQNTNPSIGSDVVGSGTGIVTGNYAVPNVFRFQSGDVVASSALPTEFNRYTISYLINVPDGQPAGRYASTLTVIATTTF